MSRHGTYEEVDGRPAVVFERVLRHPADRVWAAIGTADGLFAWFPDLSSADVRVGGALAFTFPDGSSADGEVLRLEPPRRLDVRWGTEEVRLELRPHDDGVLLRLVNLLDARDEAARNAAGWHTCLDVLDAALAGAPAAKADWQGLYAGYRDRGLPTGAPVPGA